MRRIRGDVFLLVGHDTDGPTADARIPAKQRLTIFRAIFVERAAIDNAGNDFAHIVLLRGIARKNAVKIARGVQRLMQTGVAENRRIRRPHLVGDRADAFEAGFIVGFAEVHRAADLRVHFRAAQFLGGGFLSDGGLHQGGPGKKQAGALGHQDVIAHDGKIRASGNAHAHDGGNLRDALRAHDGVVAEDPAEIVGVGKNVFLQRQKNAGGIHEIDRRDVIIDGDVLRANHFFCGHREERTSFHGCVVGDNHEHAAGDPPEAGDGSSGGSATPLFVHFPGGVDAEFKEMSAGIDKRGDALAGGEAVLFVLGFDGLGAAAFANLLFFIFERGKQLNHALRILLELR